MASRRCGSSRRHVSATELSTFVFPSKGQRSVESRSSSDANSCLTNTASLNLSSRIYRWCDIWMRSPFFAAWRIIRRTGIRTAASRISTSTGSAPIPWSRLCGTSCVGRSGCETIGATAGDHVCTHPFSWATTPLSSPCYYAVPGMERSSAA